MSTDESADRAAALERLSALVDGELDAAGVAQVCAHWREAGEMRAAWHTYQLIGDVLRSEDLAADPARDAAFLGALRTRLAAEPVVLAPQPIPAFSSHGSKHAASSDGARATHGTRLRRWAWMAPSAVAAGFVAVAGVVMLSRAPMMSEVAAPAVATRAPQAPQGPVAGAVPRLASTATLPDAATSAEPQTLVANGKLIRDARLDRYLAAHKQFAGSSALGVPSPFLRSVTVDVSDR